eukprot:tig00000144_g9166.t1
MAGAGGGRAFLSALANLHGNQDEERQRKERQRNELTANLDEQIREKQQRKAAEKHRLEALAAAEAAEQKQPQVRRFEELSEPQKEATELLRRPLVRTTARLHSFCDSYFRSNVKCAAC